MIDGLIGVIKIFYVKCTRVDIVLPREGVISTAVDCE